MKNFNLETLETLFNDCMKQLNSINIKESRDVSYEFSFFDNVETLGKCSYNLRNNKHLYVISLNISYAKVATLEQIKNTVMHETIHTFDGCMSHKNKWKYYTQLVNRYFNYNVSRQTYCPEFEEYLLQNKYKYALLCNDCKKIFCHKTKMTPILKSINNNEHKYLCPYCKSSSLITINCCN